MPDEDELGLPLHEHNTPIWFKIITMCTSYAFLLPMPRPPPVLMKRTIRKQEQKLF